VKPFLLILSAPTGAGKTTIARALEGARGDAVAFSVSATTRPPRPSERDGVDYFFLPGEEFDRREKAHEFLEWAEYGGHRYGTLISEVDRILATGRHVLLDIDVQGARKLRQRRSDVVLVFILPPNAEALLARLHDRGADQAGDLRRRLERAVHELEAIGDYDYIVVNEERNLAIQEVAAILDAESLRRERRDDMVEEARHLGTALRKFATSMPVFPRGG
jgi:guanylate kinase